MSVDEEARPSVAERTFIDAIEELRPGLYRDALRRLGDPAAADDAVQETLIRAFRASGRLRDDSNLEAWTHTILRNVCRNEYARRARDARKAARVSGDPLLNRSARPSVENELGLDHPAEVGEALDELPESYREVLELRFVDDLEYGEIADEIGVTEVNARARVSRARAAARGAFRAIAALPFLLAGLVRRGDRKAAALEKAVGASSSAPASVDPSLATRIGTLAQPAVEAVNTASSSAPGMSAVAKAAVGVTAVATVGVGVATDTNPLDVVPIFDNEPAAVVEESEPDAPTAIQIVAPAAASAPDPAPAAPAATDATVAPSTSVAVAPVAAPETSTPATTLAPATTVAEAVAAPVEEAAAPQTVSEPAPAESAAEETAEQVADEPAAPPPTAAPTTVAPTTVAPTTVPAPASSAVSLAGLSVSPAGPRVDVAGGASVDGTSGSVSGRFSFEPADGQFRLDATLELTIAGEWIELRLAGFATTDGTTPGSMSGVFRSSSTTMPTAGDFSGSIDLTSGTVALSLTG